MWEIAERTWEIAEKTVGIDAAEEPTVQQNNIRNRKYRWGLGLEIARVMATEESIVDTGMAEIYATTDSTTTTRYTETIAGGK